VAALLLLSHSAKIVEGIREMALEMGGDEGTVIAIGGTKAGTLGADYDRIFASMQSAARAGEVLVLADLGSARLTGEMAREALDADLQARVFLSDAAIVEGALVAAVSLSAGDSAQSVLKDLEDFTVPK
jgi:dihydroxyacetone kinase phosphotransfer subunit